MRSRHNAQKSKIDFLVAMEKKKQILIILIISGYSYSAIVFAVNTIITLSKSNEYKLVILNLGNMSWKVINMHFSTHSISA